MLKPVLVRDVYADEIMSTTHQLLGRHHRLGDAAIARPVLRNQAHLDPRVRTVPGTPRSPKPSSASRSSRAASDQGRAEHLPRGRRRAFSETEFEIASASATRPRSRSTTPRSESASSIRPSTDSLTGLFNHSVFYERLLAVAAGVEPHAHAAWRC